MGSNQIVYQEELKEKTPMMKTVKGTHITVTDSVDGTALVNIDTSLLGGGSNTSAEHR